jgi:hypothetical protein
MSLRSVNTSRAWSRSCPGGASSGASPVLPGPKGTPSTASSPAPTPTQSPARQTRASNVRFGPQHRQRLTTAEFDRASDVRRVAVRLLRNRPRDGLIVRGPLGQIRAECFALVPSCSIRRTVDPMVARQPRKPLFHEPIVGPALQLHRRQGHPRRKPFRTRRSAGIARDQCIGAKTNRIIPARAGRPLSDGRARG